MKNKQLILALSIAILICVAVGYSVIVWPKAPKGVVVSETAAIEILQNKFPEFDGYPGSALPPKSIKTERASNGWHVAFIQEGSGRPIISATCFFVGDDRNIVKVGVFNPQISDFTHTISPKTCKAVE